MTLNPDGSRSIQSVQRAIQILNLFTETTPELSLGEISDVLDLNKSTVHGIVNTLYINHYLGKNRINGKYMLGSALVDKFSYSAIQHDAHMIQASLSQLHFMVKKYNSTAMLFAYRNRSLVNLKNISPMYAYEYKPVLDYHCAVSGRVVLSTWTDQEVVEYFRKTPMTKYTDTTVCTLPELFRVLEAIRTQDFATEKDEIITGLSAISVPIWERDNVLTGTVSISCSTAVFDTRSENIVADLKRTSEMVSRHLNAMSAQ